MNAISCSQLSFRYAERSHQIPVLDKLDIAIPLGSLWAVVGPNGAGKSTFLKLLAGILTPSSGQLDLGGITPQQIAYLPQHTEMDRHFPINTYQLVAMGLWQLMGAFGGLNSALRRKVDTALDQVGLSGFGERNIASLSGGQLQRALFARLLLQDAGIILLDEPFNAIDSRTIADLIDILKQWQQQSRTVIAVLHDLDQVKAQFPHTLMIAHRVIASGDTPTTLSAINTQKAHEACAAYDERVLQKFNKAAS